MPSPTRIETIKRRIRLLEAKATLAWDAAARFKAVNNAEGEKLQQWEYYSYLSQISALEDELTPRR